MLEFLLVLLICAGLLFLLSLLPLPSLREKQMLRQLGKPKLKLAQVIIAHLTDFFETLIRRFKLLRLFDAPALQKKLDAAGYEMTAERYIARALSTSAVIILLAVLFLCFRIYLLSAILLVVSLIAFQRVMKEVNQRAKAKRKAIERELPQFMRTITQTLLYSRDLLTMVDKYRAVAGPASRRELDQLVLDMKIGNHEDALDAFAKRINIDYLSNFTSGLISQSKGISQREYLISVERDLKKQMHEDMKIRALRQPKKLKWAMRMLYVSVAGCWLTALGLEAWILIQGMLRY